MSQEGNQIIIEGIAYWAHVNKTNQYGNYSIDLVVDDATATKLRNLGIKQAMRKTGEQDEYGDDMKAPKSYEAHPGKVFNFGVNMVSDTGEIKLTKSGKPKSGPIVVGPDLQPFTDEIGNGSKVKLKVGLYLSTNPKTGKQSQGKALNAVQVLDLVPYSGGGKALDGFEVVRTEANDFSGGIDF